MERVYYPWRRCHEAPLISGSFRAPPFADLASRGHSTREIPEGSRERSKRSATASDVGVQRHENDRSVVARPIQAPRTSIRTRAPLIPTNTAMIGTHKLLVARPQRREVSERGVALRTVRLREKPELLSLSGTGGESGIRTHGRVSPTHAFQACSFNHSDISPYL